MKPLDYKTANSILRGYWMLECKFSTQTVEFSNEVIINITTNRGMFIAYFFVTKRIYNKLIKTYQFN